MTKRTTRRMTKRNQPKHKEIGKEGHADDNVADKISELPDDILVSIISCLSLREATATSVLSSRWQPLHTRVSRLSFPPFCPDQSEYIHLIQKKFREYRKMINHTLDSYKGGRTLKEFRAHMYRLEGVNIKRWLRFALSREVEIIDIRMTSIYIGVSKVVSYRLPLESLIKCERQTDFKCLRELSLCHVGVDDTELKLVLSSFPNLESLSLECPTNLRNVSIVGHPIKLQRLNISHANKIESIEIKNMINLVSLRCCGLLCLPSEFGVSLNNLPKLTELETTDEGSGRSTLCNLLSKFPPCIRSQLLVVRLLSASCKYAHFEFPELINVTRLELECGRPSYCRSADILIKLLVACQFLEKLEMKFKWHQATAKGAKLGHRDAVCRYSWMKEASPKLKEVKLLGYLGNPTDLELAMFIIKNAGALLELIVEPCRETNQIQKAAIANFWKQLGPIIPNSLTITIIYC